MVEYGVALDLGTSGFRAQAIDLSSFKVISTAITLRHPLPGINIMDHLTFVIEYGENIAHNIVIDAVDRILERLQIDTKLISKIAICGNPVQLSLFQGIECRDLAWAGEQALKIRGIIPPDRNSRILEAGEVGLRSVKSNVEILVPPCIKHELGADAIAMMVKSGFIKEKLAIVADYGTNAEIALKVGDEILTGSAAAGPAIEGQSIEKGVLASPGAISDLISLGDTKCRCVILNNDMYPVKGDVLDMGSGEIYEVGEFKARGITGTGVIAAIALGLNNGLIKLPRILTPDRKIHLQEGIYLSEKDIKEAGKALGAFRAGFLTLAEEGNVNLSDVKVMYMAGASGFYVDPIKAKIVGEIPPNAEKIYQVGNTSLALAVDILKNAEYLDDLQEFAKELRDNHVMFATSEIFKKLYILELSFWLEGLNLERYNEFITKYKICQKITAPSSITSIQKIYSRDIAEFGLKGLHVITDIGTYIVLPVPECKECEICINTCPERAITSIRDKNLFINSSLCLGTACRRCVSACPVKTINFQNAEVKKNI